MRARRWMHRFWGDLFALLAGASVVLAFAPYNLYLFAVLAPACLFYVWHSSPPGLALRRGWVFGVGMFGTSISWIHVSLNQFGGMDLSASYLATAFFVMFLALYPAILGWLVVKIFPDCTRVRLLLVWPAGWTLMEWIRGWFLSGFPWQLLGYSQTDSPLAGFMPLVGAYGVTWLLVFSASLCVYLFLAGRRVLLPVVPALLGLWGVAWGLTQVDWGERINEKPLQVAIVQASIPQEFTLNYSSPELSLQRYVDLSKQHLGVDLMVWPETAIPLFYQESQWFLEGVDGWRKQFNTDFIIGIRVDERRPDGVDYYNSAISISDKPGKYHKTHLVPFGEFLPLRHWLQKGLQILQVPVFADFTRGAEYQPLLHAAGLNIAATICYEDAFPTPIRGSADSADLFVNVSNDAWFGDSIAADQHLQISRTRALEAGRYLIRATNTGFSAIIDAKGRVLGRTGHNEVTVLRGEVYGLEGRTPFAMAGNVPLVFLMFFCLGVAFVLNRYWHLAPISTATRLHYRRQAALRAARQREQQAATAAQDSEES